MSSSTRSSDGSSTGVSMIKCWMPSARCCRVRLRVDRVGDAWPHDHGQRLGIATGIRPERPQPTQPIGKLVHRDPSRMPTVTDARDASERRIGMPAPKNWNGALHRAGQHGQTRSLPSGPVDVHVLPGPQRAHNGHHLLGTPAAVVEWHTKRAELFLHPSDPEPQDHAAAREVVEARELLGEQNRVPERREQDRRSDLHAGRGGRGPRQGQERIDVGACARRPQPPVPYG